MRICLQENEMGAENIRGILVDNCAHSSRIKTICDFLVHLEYGAL